MILFRLRLPIAAATLSAVVLSFAAHAAPDPCAGIEHCQNLGPFTATVLKVNVTRQDTVTAYQGVRTTVRFTNIGRQPLVLAYRDHSSLVTDNNGLAYKRSARAYGIGVVTRDSADPQFELAPGESREASFDGTLQYSMRRQVAGNVFTHDIGIVQLAVEGDRRVREVRDYAVSFAGLTSTSGYGGAPAPGGASPVTASPQGAAGPVAGSGAGGDACAGQPACQAQGPFTASVVRVTVTDSGRVTANHVVRTTLRFRNVSDRPIALGYRRNSNRVSDNQGHTYTRFTSTGGDAAHVFGIGLVTDGSADPQFTLAPGESRDASFEAALQYNVRYTQPGTVFSQDMTIAELEIVGPRQVRTAHDYALTFSNLTATTGGGLAAGTGPAGGPAPNADAVNKVVDLFKALRR
ncbi:MAG TPA: hypothetical protein VFF72_08045 [Caldimonas sp.]|nr:hypothetical protein [Caldimonas sp.]